MITQRVLSTLQTFARQGAEVVHVSRCCGRCYIGLEPPIKCSTCPKVPVVHRVALKPALPTEAELGAILGVG